MPLAAALPWGSQAVLHPSTAPGRCPSHRAWLWDPACLVNKVMKQLRQEWRSLSVRFVTVGRKRESALGGLRVTHCLSDA